VCIGSIKNDLFPAKGAEVAPNHPNLDAIEVKRMLTVQLCDILTLLIILKTQRANRILELFCEFDLGEV
jgi:hypothetical protein